MKFASTLFAVALATSVSAFALPVAEPQNCWRQGQICNKEKRDAEAQNCWRQGQICNKVKRAADAFAEAVASPDDILDARCESAECFSARLKLRELAGLVAVTVRDAKPEAYLASLNLRNEFEIRRDALAFQEKRAADPQNCWRQGQICNKEKREAEALAQNCWRQGQICNKERREADPEAQNCWRQGQICNKLKRAAAAVAEALADPQNCWRQGQICNKEKREAEAEAQNCWRQGQICNKEKRDAEAEAVASCGEACTMAKRDASALAAAANDILSMAN